MQHIDTVIVGAGQAGLAVSHQLAVAGLDHVVLERHEIGARWRRNSWDSLRLLTPNWMNVLPGGVATGPDPEGFTTATGFARHLDRYASSFGSPVESGAAVEAVRPHGCRFEVATTAGTWLANHVVIATGWCDQPAIPTLAKRIPVAQLAPSDYRRPGDLPPGGVLVVGASATGVQLAHELAATGRHVTLAVGTHTRVPRTYRGMDIFWWLRRIGALDRTIDTMPDVDAARHEPSLQLVGGHERRDLDLPGLQAAGVHLAGRLVAAEGRSLTFADDLGRNAASADRRLAGLLRRIDHHIEAEGLGAEVLAAEPFRPLLQRQPSTALDLRRAGIGTVLWATGHRRAYPWLHLPVLDGRGEIHHVRGVTDVPGLFVIGQRFQHRRSSNFIYGVGADAAHLAAQITRRGPQCHTPRQEDEHVHR